MPEISRRQPHRQLQASWVRALRLSPRPLRESPQLRKTFGFFSSTSSEGPVDELVLAGGCALTPNLQQILRERFEVPTELMNPLRRVHWKDPSRRLHELAPAAWAAAAAQVS